MIGVTSSHALRRNARSTWQHREGLAKRRQHRHPPRAQPVAPVRERHCRRPRLTPEAWHRAGTPRWRTREAQRHHRFIVPRDAMPRPLAYFRLLASEAIDMTAHERNR